MQKFECSLLSDEKIRFAIVTFRSRLPQFNFFLFPIGYRLVTGLVLLNNGSKLCYSTVLRSTSLRLESVCSTLKNVRVQYNNTYQYSSLEKYTVQCYNTYNTVVMFRE